MKYKIIGNPGDEICIVTTEDETKIIAQNGKIIITSYDNCKTILHELWKGGY